MSSPQNPSAKVCIQCGQDCSTKPRTKDAQGRYTCKACFDKLAARAAAAKAPAVEAVAVPVAAAVDEGGGEDAVMAALLKDAGGSTLTENCPSCGSGLQPGAVVCTICGYNKQTGKTVRTGKAFAGEGGIAEGGAGAVVKKVATAPLVLAMSAVGAMVGGAIGAVVWAMVAYGLDREIAWVAIGVGIATGIGAAIPAGKRAGVMTGLIAAVISVIAVGAGKYAAASMVIDDVLKKNKDFREATRHKVTDEELIGLVARDVVKEHEQAGKTDQWPDGVDHDEAVEESEFPPAVWKEAKERFDGLSESAKEDRRASTQALYNAGVQAQVEEIKARGFASTFSPFDLLWFGLAIFTAFRAGSGLHNATNVTGKGGRKAAKA